MDGSTSMFLSRIQKEAMSSLFDVFPDSTIPNISDHALIDIVSARQFAYCGFINQIAYFAYLVFSELGGSVLFSMTRWLFQYTIAMQHVFASRYIFQVFKSIVVMN